MLQNGSKLPSGEQEEEKKLVYFMMPMRSGTWCDEMNKCNGTVRNKRIITEHE
jgi:hypothetical protein